MKILKIMVFILAFNLICFADNSGVVTKITGKAFLLQGKKQTPDTLERLYP